MTGASDFLIELSGVGVAFGRRAALENVSLSLRPAEIVTVVGPNGAGKTTLLRVVLGLQRPNAGRIERRPGLRIGYVPQRFAIDETLPLTVSRFLSLVPGARSKIGAALGEVGAAHTLDLPVQTLSGGEMQRVLLARALLREPELLVLDEPVQGVDIAGQTELFALIRRVRDVRGCAVLLVSHDLHLVMAATDHVVCLNHHVCCSGHPEEVSRDPAYRALFGAAVDGFALYAHHHDHSHDGHGHDEAPHPREPADIGPGHG
ncbi:MAG TPA: zinc ABC transporter ATP-binding protein ZnuC [Stellaceae bacterium]|nr:zinc ABC transporter ATP-binding protein ZnuC [Stellaceae bacterium]